MAISINDVLKDIQAYRQAGQKYVKNWHDDLPEGSKWFPGSRADPGCKICEGMGYVRLDLPVGHKFFGKVFECECVSAMMAKRTSQPYGQ